jgi:hypothetical protein
LLTANGIDPQVYRNEHMAGTASTAADDENAENDSDNEQYLNAYVELKFDPTCPGPKSSRWIKRRRIVRRNIKKPKPMLNLLMSKLQESM